VWFGRSQLQEMQSGIYSKVSYYWQGSKIWYRSTSHCLFCQSFRWLHSWAMEERKLITARNAGGVLGNIDTSGRGCNTKWPIHPLLHQLWQIQPYL
jgi:hypothetical protein